MDVSALSGNTLREIVLNLLSKEIPLNIGYAQESYPGLLTQIDKTLTDSEGSWKNAPKEGCRITHQNLTLVIDPLELGEYEQRMRLEIALICKWDKE